VIDYWEVSRDVMMDMRKHTIKSYLWIMFSGMMIALHTKRPAFTCYKTDLMGYSNELGLCSERARSNHAKVYIDKISTLLNNGCIQFVDLGIFSMIIQHPHSPRSRNYCEVCKHLQPRLWTFHHRVIDVGIWNQWLTLERTMVDFDVNTSEFELNY